MDWKGIGRLFVQYEEEEKKVPVQETEAPVEEVKEVAPAVDASSGQHNQGIAETLAKALEEANIEGYDYFEFAKTLEALKPNMPAEQVLYQTAYASGSVMGVTKDKLVQTAQHYLDVLSQKQKEFNLAVNKQTEDTVTSKEQHVSEIEEQIKSKAEQIQALTDEINQLSSQKTEANNEISANKVKIEQVKNDFAATLQAFSTKINSDVQKIEKYLGTQTQAAAQ